MKKLLIYLLGIISALSVAYAGFTVIDGAFVLEGDARVQKAMWIPINGLKGPGVSPATFVENGIAGAWEFADGDDDILFATMRLPQDMDRTEAPEIRIGFSSPTNAGDVVWQIEYLYITLNESTTASAQETLSGAYTISTTANGLTVATITGLDLPATSDQLVRFRITRMGDDGADTLSDDANMVGFGMKYVADKLGVAL